MIFHSSILTCPSCKALLVDHGKSYSCSHNHLFDKARQGYINLLLPNQKNSHAPGDSKEMVIFRRAFLNQEYYTPIANTLNAQVLKKIPSFNNDLIHIGDIGCGEGYYLHQLKDHIDTSVYKNVRYWGMDISKEAVKMASHTYKNISWLVSSGINIPFQNHSLQMLLSIFSPYTFTEFKRILAPDAFVFMITPGASHLIELRQMLFSTLTYKDPHQILQKTEPFLQLDKNIPLTYSINLRTKEDIDALVKMTPLYWKSSPLAKEQLSLLQTLDVTIEVNLWIFKNCPT